MIRDSLYNPFVWSALCTYEPHTISYATSICLTVILFSNIGTIWIQYYPFWYGQAMVIEIAFWILQSKALYASQALRLESFECSKYIFHYSLASQYITYFASLKYKPKESIDKTKILNTFFMRWIIL